MDTLRDLDVVRALPSRTLLRAADDGAMPFLEVRFSPFNVWYEIASWWEGDFMERTVRGAFAKTMKEQRDNIKVLYDHGYGPPGNMVLAPIEELSEEADSAYGGGRLFDTSYNRDLLPGLEAKVYGSSFRFRVIKDEWNDEPGASEHNPKGLPERTITENRLFEFGPVTFPASPTATAGVRSLTDEYHERARSRDPQRYTDLVARHKAIRTPERPSAAERTDASGAATATDEPALSHSHRDSASDLARRIRVGRVLRGI
jgi:HK97 family phage prohead protease